MPTSVTFDEFTWTFSANKVVGFFESGIPYVVGPVTITSITPACEVVNIIAPSIDISTPDDYVINGSMVNPIPHGDYGFSSMIVQYVEAGNAALDLPLSLVAGDSLVSSICYTTQPQTNQGHIRKVGVLMVLAAAPSTPQLCPHPYGSDERDVILVSDINWAKLPRRTALATTPSLIQMQAYMTGLPKFEYHSAWWGYASLPAENLGTTIASSYSAPSTYGADRQARMRDLALGIQTDVASIEDIKEICIEIIQEGIFIIGASMNGLKWEGNGSHRQGRWFAAVFAAAMLERQDWLDWISSDDSFFQERGNLFIVGVGDVGRVTDSGRTWVTEQIGMPEWGIQHNHTPATDDPDFPAGSVLQEVGEWPVPGLSGPYYRGVNWGPQGGIAVALRGLGMVVEANCPKFFQYEERNEAVYVGGYGLDSMTGAFRAAYFDSFGPLGPAVPIFDPPARGYESPVTVTILVSPGATAYYTDNGTEATEASTEYTTPISISATKTLNVIVAHPDYGSTAYAAGTFTIDSSGKPSAVIEAIARAL